MVQQEAMQQPAGEMRQQEGGAVGGQQEYKRAMTRGQEGGATRGNATTSLCKMTRGRRSERMMRDVGSSNDNCSDNSNDDSNGDADSSNGDSGDDNSNSNSGGSNSNSARKTTIN